MAEQRNKKSVHSPESPPPTQRHRPQQKNLLTLAFKKLTTPTGFIISLLLFFLLGYISHPQPPPSRAEEDLHHHNTFTTHTCGEPVPPENVRQTVIDKVFNGVSPWEGFPPKYVISDNLLLKDWTKGWGSNAAVFEHLIEKVKPKTIIEVGTFLGASATHMAGLIQKLGLKDTQILCIDDFRGWPGYNDGDNRMKIVNGDVMLLYQFLQNVVKSNATDSILFLPFSTSTALGGLCDWGVFGDLVEVDAAHDFHSAWVDINNAYKVLKKPAGILFGHDYVREGVQKAVHLFAQLHGLRIEIDGEHWVLH